MWRKPARPGIARGILATPLYRLFDSLYDEVRGQWEERFEQQYGFWRGFVDEQVRRYLDCGLFENGFARVRVEPEDGSAVERLARYIMQPPISLERVRC